MDDISIRDFEILKTRANSYPINVTEASEKNEEKRRKITRKAYFDRKKGALLCKDHIKQKEPAEQCSSCITFEPEAFPSGRLPTLKTTINAFLAKKLETKDQSPEVRNNLELELSRHLCLTWINCNVYPNWKKFFLS